MRWDRAEQFTFLRGIDAVAGLLTLPAGNGPAGRLVVTRLLTSMFELLTGSDAEEEVERAEKRVDGLTARDTASEADVREWLTRECRARAQDHNWDFEDGDWGAISDDHDAWTLLALGPFARRLRLWTHALKLSAPALGAAIGTGAHQIRHWANGRTLPSADQRTALATAMGVHPAWLASARDHSADSDLYLYACCPCGTGAAFTRDVVATAHAELSVRWCRACGQPLVSAGTSGLLPLPLAGLTDPPAAGYDEPFAFHAVYTKNGRDLSAPWPHGLWCPGTDSRQRGPVRIPAQLTRPPVTPPLPPPPPPRPVARRRALRNSGQVPKAAVQRSGPEKIQAFLQWVGDGRQLTGTRQIRLSDARMLVEALPTGDVWDPVEYGYQCRTRSSAELPHLQRIVLWTTAAGLLTYDGDRLVPVTAADPRAFQTLPDLVRTLVEALPDVAVHRLTQVQLLSPIADDEGVQLALAVIRHVLLHAAKPVTETVVGDVLWRELTCDGEDPFEEDKPGEAERTVRRDLGRLLHVCQDLDLIERTAELLTLTTAGRTLPWAGELEDDGWFVHDEDELQDDEEPEPRAPNYANLFPLRHTRSNAWQFTPRTAYVLDALLTQLGAEAAASAEALGDTTLQEEDRAGGGLFASLPRATWAQGYPWRRDFARRIYDLAGDIAAGTVPHPRCVAERIALDLALDRARAHTSALAGNTPVYDELPEHHHDDWDSVDRALRAADHPVPEGLPILWRVAPDSWFIPFAKSQPRDRDHNYLGGR